MDDIIRDCKERIERGSKSFAGAARLLPTSVRYDTYMLYAWCRYCDDVIDDQDFGFATQPKPMDDQEKDNHKTALDRLADLTHKTKEALVGKATEPVFIALQQVVKKHEIPQKHPLELLHGFAMDVEKRQFHTLEDTLDYSYHVAGVVGVMMAMIMGVRDKSVLHRASDLGIAFQLTNISRDVVDDAQIGRIYLPENWLHEHNIPLDNIALYKHRPELANVVTRLLDTADEYYDSASVGISHLPVRCALAIAAARRIYKDIGNIVRSRHENAWDERVIVPKSRKYSAVAKSVSDVFSRQTWGLLTRNTPRPNLWTKADLGV